MTLRDYFNGLSKDERTEFAERAGTSIGYIWLLSGAHRRPSPGLVMRLVIASNGQIIPEELRPDLKSIFGIESGSFSPPSKDSIPVVKSPKIPRTIPERRKSTRLEERDKGRRSGDLRREKK